MFPYAKSDALGTLVSRVWLVLVFSGSFLGAIFVVGRFLPQPLDTWEKQIEFLRRNPSKYAVLFVGSSNFYHGIDPNIFDEAVRLHGITIGPSFNASVRGGVMHQKDFVLRKLIEKGSVQPEYIFIDASDFDIGVNAQRRETGRARMREWHNLNQTRSVIRAIWNSDSSQHPISFGPEGKLSLIARHLNLLIGYYLPVGHFFHAGNEAAEWSFHVPNPFMSALYPDEAEVLESTRGYYPYGERGSEHTIVHRVDPVVRRYLDAPSLWENRIAELMRKKELRVPEKPRNLEAFLDQISLVGKTGSRLIYVESPSTHLRSPPFWWMIDRGILATSNDQSGRPIYKDFNVKGISYVDDIWGRFDLSHIGPTQVPEFSKDLAYWFIDTFHPEFAQACENVSHQHVFN